MLDIKTRSPVMGATGSKAPSALELMRDLPRYGDKVEVSEATAKAKFKAFVDRYDLEAPAMRGRIFREFAADDDKHKFVKEIADLVHDFRVTHRDDANLPTAAQGGAQSLLGADLSGKLSGHNNRDARNKIGKIVNKLPADQRSVIWQAAAEAIPAAAKKAIGESLGAGLLRDKAKTVLEDCRLALKGDAARTPQQTEPILYVIRQLQEVCRSKKIGAQTQDLIEKIGLTDGGRRARSASQPLSVAEAREALQLPKAIKKPIATLRIRNADPDFKPELSSLICEGQPEYSGIVSQTFARGEYTKIRMMLTFSGKFFAVRVVHIENAEKDVPTMAADAQKSSKVQTIKINEYYNQEYVLRLVDSPLKSLASGMDAKGRAYSVVRAYDGSLDRLMAGLAGTPKARMFSLAAEKVLEAVANLEEKNYVHGDIKPDNVLYDLSGEIALSDYGKAHSRDIKSVVGAGPFRPPEEFSPNFSNHPKYDLYSLGLTLVCLAVGEDEFSNFPLSAAGKGYAAIERIFELWKNVEPGAKARLDIKVRSDLEKIDAAYNAMRELDPSVAKLAFEYLLQADPGKRSSAAEVLKKLRADNIDRVEGARQVQDALNTFALRDPQILSKRALMRKLEAASKAYPASQEVWASLPDE